MMPLFVESDTWETLRIPKQSMVWTSEVSLAVLSSVRDFLKYVLIDVMNADQDTLHMLLPSRIEVGDMRIPAVFEEFKRELAWLKSKKVDFCFLERLVK